MSISRLLVSLAALAMMIQVYLIWAWGRSSLSIDHSQALLNDICALDQMPVGSSIRRLYHIGVFLEISNGTARSDTIYAVECGRLEIKSGEIVYTLPVRVKEKIRLRGSSLLTLEKRRDGVWLEG